MADLRLRHVVARNMFWNWVGMVVDVGAGFLIAPFLVRQLGVTGYGLWIVIGALSGYFSLVDLGLRGSAGRHLALERARSDWTAVSRTLTSALALFATMALVTIVATGVATMFFDRWFDVPPDQISNARLALFLVGVNLALSFPLQAFDGYLWAAQRFDILNWVDIPTTLVRLGLTIAFVHDRFDIVTLALITLATGAGSGIVKAILSFKLDPELRVSRAHLSRESGRGLLEYGWWNFVITVASLTKTQLSPVLIGSFLGIALVTPFSIARRLQDYAQKVIWTATGVLIPVATGYHALSQGAQQQMLFIEGGKYSTAVAIFFAALFVFLGKPLISLWMGPQFAYVSLLLTILALGALVPMTQALTGTIMLATARHRVSAWLSIAETIVSVTLIAILARPYGLVGICLALAIPQFVFTGMGMVIFGCRFVHIGLWRYFRDALLPAILASVVPIAALAGLVTWRFPGTWVMFFGYSCVFAATYAISAWIVFRPTFADRAITDLKTALFHT